MSVRIKFKSSLMNTPAFDPTLYCTHEQVDLLWEKEVYFSWLQSPLNKGF